MGWGLLGGLTSKVGSREWTAEATWSGRDLGVVRGSLGERPQRERPANVSAVPTPAPAEARGTCPVSWPRRCSVRPTELRWGGAERRCSNATSLQIPLHAVPPGAGHSTPVGTCV